MSIRIVGKQTNVIKDDITSHKKTWSSERIQQISVPIQKPNISEFTFTGGTVQTSPYKSSETYIGEHTASDWELYDENGELAFSSYNDTLNLRSWAPRYPGSGSYKIRVRYISNNEFRSEWSDYFSVQVHVGILAPVLNITDTKYNNFKIQASEYTPIAHSEPHTSTDWEIATDSSFSNIVFSSYDDTTNLTSITVTSGLSPNIKYYIRARYKSTSYTSDWGVTSDTTIAYNIDDVLEDSYINNQTVNITVTVDNGNTFSGTLVANTTLGTISINGDTITWNIPDIDSDTQVNWSMHIEDSNGHVLSKIYTKTVTVLDIDATYDQTAVLTTNDYRFF